MAHAAPRPCRIPGCRELVLARDGYCDAHRRQSHQRYNDERQASGSRVKLYDSAAWKRARIAQLREYPLCHRCLALGRTTEAAVVDHVIPIKRGGAELDSNNLQSLCKPCHNAKTRQEGQGG